VKSITLQTELAKFINCYNGSFMLLTSGPTVRCTTQTGI